MLLVIAYTACTGLNFMCVCVHKTAANCYFAVVWRWWWSLCKVRCGRNDRIHTDNEIRKWTKCTSSVLITTVEVDDAHIEHTVSITQSSPVKSYHLTISSSGRPIRLSSKSLKAKLWTKCHSLCLTACQSAFQRQLALFVGLSAILGSCEGEMITGRTARNLWQLCKHKDVTRSTRVSSVSRRNTKVSCCCLCGQRQATHYERLVVSRLGEW